jgi:hypothetical protein
LDGSGTLFLKEQLFMPSVSRDIAIGLSVAVALVAVGGGSYFVSSHYYGFNDVRQAVNAKLNGTSSAGFRNIKKANVPGDVYCGDVNVRNADDSFTGFHSFVLIDHARVIIMDEKIRDTKEQQEGLEYFKNGTCTGALRW